MVIIVQQLYKLSVYKNYLGMLILNEYYVSTHLINNLKFICLH